MSFLRLATAFVRTTGLSLGLCLAGTPAHAAPNNYLQTNLVASSDSYAPLHVDPTLVNAWGIAIRPAGLGGHFWIGSNGTGLSSQWVGDAGGVPLYQDELRIVSVPGPVTGSGATPSQPVIAPGTPTGVAFNGGLSFVVNQGSITAPAKFLFATDNGTISGWTERKNPDGSFDRPHNATTVIDRSADGVQYFGLSVDEAGGRLYTANFGQNPGILVYDGGFNDISASAGFANPFGGGYQPFNVQVLDGQVFVAYAEWGTPGEEVTGSGRVAEFSTGGDLQQIWGDGAGLDAPWGFAIAPADFGAFSGHLLVSNFGDGSIAAFDPATHAFVDVLRDANGNAIEIEGIWGLQFGNGASLGEADRLYFAAGPEDETAGLFGSLAAAPIPEADTWAMLLAGLAGVGVMTRRKQRT